MLYLPDESLYPDIDVYKKKRKGKLTLLVMPRTYFLCVVVWVF